MHNSEILDLINQIEDENIDFLNEWELNFLDSIRKQVAEGGKFLTEKQIEKFYDIRAKVERGWEGINHE